MKIDFKNLEDYLFSFGYPYNEMMKSESFEIPNKTAYEYLKDNIQNYMDIDAMTFYGKKISYRNFLNEIEKTAKALKYLGLKEKDRIALLLPNIPETAYLQYAASKIGAVPSNIDPRTTGKMLLNYIKIEKIKSIIVVDLLYENAIFPIEKELRDLYDIKTVIILPVTNSLPTALKTTLLIKNKFKNASHISSDNLKLIYWNELIKMSKDQNVETVKYYPNREAVIQHSSGTSSGLPKSIPLTNENINSFVEKHRPTIFGTFKYGTKILNVLPYFAAYGAINCSHLGLNLGFTIQQIPEFKFSDFGLLAAKHKSNILIGTPTWFSLASKDTRLKSNSLSNVVMAISGGDSIDEITRNDVNTFLKKHGALCEITNGHGMSELSGSGCYQFPNHINGVGIGVPFPYDKYIILDNDKKIVKLDGDGIKGCVWIYSPSATSGEFEGNIFAETISINGFRFINSKDTMYINHKNELFYLEREDKTFTRFDGHKIVPFDIESKFKQNPNIRQCIVVPYFDVDIQGKMPIAYVVTKTEMDFEDKNKIVLDIIDSLLKSEDTNDRDIPRKICFISEIPITAMSKNDYRNLMERKLDGSEFTININETNLKSSGVEIIKPQFNNK